MVFSWFKTAWMTDEYYRNGSPYVNRKKTGLIGLPRPAP